LILGGYITNPRNVEFLDVTGIIKDSEMFELFTERARRVIFFGRYEASQTGSTTIETEHLLLALIRENASLFGMIPNVKTPAFREELLPVPYGPPTPSAIDLPLSASARRVLQYADKEHQVFGDSSISSGHILLGILREVASPSAKILAKYGITREYVIEKMKQEPEVPMDTGTVGTLAHRPADSRVWHDDDATVVESNLALPFWLRESQHAVQACVFDDLNGVKNADGREVACEREVFAFEMRFGRGCGLQVRATRATNGFETGGDVYPFVELFGLEQALVGRVEVFSFEVKTSEGQALACRFFTLLVGGADLTQSFAQFD